MMNVLYVDLNALACSGYDGIRDGDKVTLLGGDIMSVVHVRLVFDEESPTIVGCSLHFDESFRETFIHAANVDRIEG